MFRSLRESQRRLDEAQRIAHVGYWERDLDLGTIRLSEESGRIFGLQHDDVLDLSEWNERWLTLIHPEDRPRTAAAAEAAIRGSGQYDVEYRVVRADGSVRFVHSRGVVIRDTSEKPVRMFGMMQDITELRQVESELLAAETRFRTFVDHATDALFVHDDSGRVLDVNREACESLGYQRAELLGLTPALFDWQAGADPGFALRIRSRLDAGESFDFESTHRRKDGSLFPVEVRTRPFWHGGRRFALSLSRDITERKRAEQEREHIRRLEHERRRPLVHVATMLERIDQVLISRHVREDAQLDLRIVRAQEKEAGCRHEPFADLRTRLRPDGNVLKVRVVRRQATGLRSGQAEAGVDATGLRIDLLL
jgi:PAS domain S-box-containing protein